MGRHAVFTAQKRFQGNIMVVMARKISVRNHPYFVGGAFSIVTFPPNLRHIQKLETLQMLEIIGNVKPKKKVITSIDYKKEKIRNYICLFVLLLA